MPEHYTKIQSLMFFVIFKELVFASERMGGACCRIKTVYVKKSLKPFFRINTRDFY